MRSVPEHRTGLGLGLGLAAWFAGFFVLTVIGVYGLSYYLVGNALRDEWTYERMEVARSVITGEPVGATIREETGRARPNEAMRASIDQHFRETFFVLVLPIVALGLLGGIAGTYWAARPVRRVVHTVQAILDTGDLERRVEGGGGARGTGELAALLNRLLDRIDGLVTAQRASLDAVAHDLRTPLTRLRASAEEAARHLDDPDACRAAIEDFLDESERLTSLVTKLMDVTVAETGTMRLETGPVAVGDVLRDVAALYELVAEERRIAVLVRDGVVPPVPGDRDRLRQVFANLLDNAIKYSPEGSTVTLSTALDGADVVVTVVDHGIGIAAVDQPHIWDRLYRADPSRRTPGLGLGLSLCRAIVTAHGGSIGIESTPGAGSTFTVRLPARAP